MALLRILVLLLSSNGIVQAHRLRHRSMQLKNSTIEHQQPQAQDDCEHQMEKMRDPAQQKAAAACEKEGNFPAKVISALQAGDEKQAIAHAEQLFTQCAKLSSKCASLAAPSMVIQLRISGMAVSDDCMKKFQRIQEDEKQMISTQKCDAKAQLSEKSLNALQNNNLNGALNATEEGLHKCMGLSKKCSYQLAPVIVNSIIQRTMQQAEAEMTTVLVAHPIIVVEEPVMVVEEQPQALAKAAVNAAKPPAVTVLAKSSPAQHKAVSLLAFAMDHQPTHSRQKSGAQVLLQENARRAPWISKFLVQLYLKQLA